MVAWKRAREKEGSHFQPLRLPFIELLTPPASVALPYKIYAGGDSYSLSQGFHGVSVVPLQKQIIKTTLIHTQ